MQKVICQIKSYIQPFERSLALQELQALTQGPIIPVDGDYLVASRFAIEGTNDVTRLRESLAFWQSVGGEANGVTRQVTREATAVVARSLDSEASIQSSSKAIAVGHLPNHRVLRYATHGIHEYRGKFFPQLVRALMNISRIPSDAIVLDPMCGSGTALVEARLAGRKSFGLDMNPLSVFMANVKCGMLNSDSQSLFATYNNLHESILSPSETEADGQFSSLPDRDQAYLIRWFDSPTIRELDHINSCISRLEQELHRDFYRVALSNILRRASWQNVDDLRVRRERKPVVKGQAITLFLAEALRSTQTVGAFLKRERLETLPDYSILEADARQAATALPDLAERADVAITSPPYATALPYIDTDRLSLAYLGLLPREHHRTKDRLMIGNREITPNDRSHYWAFYQENQTMLPEETRSLIDRIHYLNESDSVGFRRKNLSALLSRYFFDMRDALQQVFALLRPGGVLFLIVGNNRTVAGKERIEIRTADHLGRIATSIGFRWHSDVAMDMLVSRDIFRKNAVPSETILQLEKPQ